MNSEANRQNEIALMGALLYNERTMDASVLDQLRPEMLASPQNQDIVKVLKALRAEGSPFDSLVISGRLASLSADNSKLKPISQDAWMNYLIDCGEYMNKAGNIHLYASEVRSHWYKTKLKELFNRADQMTVDDIDEELGRLKHMADTVSRVREGQIGSFKRKRDVRGVASSIDLVTEESRVGGYPAGQCSVILARSGDGKSAFMLQEALHMAALKHPVLYVTVADLSGEDITDRLLQMQTGWGEMPESEHVKARYVQLAKELKELPITVRDASADVYGRTVESVCGRIERFAEQHKGGRLAVVFVDYFQELSTGRARDFSSGYERDLHISSQLIDVSKSTQLPIIIGSQITIANGIEKTKGGDFLNDRSGLTLRINRFRDEAERKGVPDEYKHLEGLGTIRINKSRFGRAWKPCYVTFGKDLKLKEL